MLDISVSGGESIAREINMGNKVTMWFNEFLNICPGWSSNQKWSEISKMVIKKCFNILARVVVAFDFCQLSKIKMENKILCSTLYVKLYWHSGQRRGSISFLSTGWWTNLFDTGICPQSGCPTLQMPTTCQFPISAWVKSRINGPGYLQSLFGKSLKGLCQRNSGAFGLT